MITSKQYDELTDLLEKYRAAIDYVHTASPQYKLDAAYGFADADKAIESYILELVDFDGIAKQAAADTDGWVEWGGECPVSKGDRFELKFRDGTCSLPEIDGRWSWPHFNSPDDIVAYRIVK